jgi:hypothetical protein
MTHWSDRNRIEELSTGECDLQDTDTEFIDEATALVERKTLERLIDAVYGPFSPLAGRRPKVQDDEPEAS